MSNNIVLLAPGAQLPAYMLQSADARKALAEINSDVITGQAFPSLSIKGKVFAIVRGDERKIVTRPDDPDAAASSVNLAVVRANSKSRVYFAKQYVEGEQGPEARPDCASADGVVPMPGVSHKQAESCAVCPHAVWGSRANMEGKGTACSVNTRMSVFNPESPTYLNDGRIETFLLRAPAASRAGFAQVVSAATSRGIPYNAMVIKVTFDMEAPSPKLLFKPIGFLSDAMYAQVQKQYDDDLTKDMMGLRQVATAPSTPVQTQADKDMDELQGQPPAAAVAPAEPPPPPPPPPPAPAPVAAAPAATTDPFAGMDAAAPAAAPVQAPAPAPARQRRPRAEGNAPPPAPAAAPVAANDPPAPAPAPVQAPAPAAAPVAAAAPAQYDDLLGQLDTLLSVTDD